MTTAHADTRLAEPVPSEAAPSLSSRTLGAAAPRLPRVDLYAPIHKALRSAMTETLAKVGSLDVFDADEMATTLAQVDALLDLCVHHLERENAFVHTAIEARQPAGAERTAHDHVEHLLSIDALRDEARALQAANPDERMGLAQRLYRHLALFVAENFQHIHIEETVNNAALWAAYSDTELLDLHGRLMASISPHEHLAVARWMLPALSPVERAGMLNAAKEDMPPECFLGVIDHVRPHIDARGWDKLAAALGIAPRPARAAAA